MYDIWVVARKEFREQLQRRGEVFRYMWFAILFGGVLPVANVINGRQVLIIVSAPWLAYAGVFIASSATLGAFFTERQRGTLESLLATPLPDVAIFVGKVIFSLFISLVSVAAAVVVEVVMVNLALRISPHLRAGFGGLFFTFPPVFYFALLVTLPTILVYTIGIGTLVSLRVDSVRTANLFNILATFLLAVPIGLLTPLVRIGITWEFLTALSLVMVVVDVVVLWVAVRCFSRETAVLNVLG